MQKNVIAALADELGGRPDCEVYEPPFVVTYSKADAEDADCTPLPTP